MKLEPAHLSALDELSRVALGFPHEIPKNDDIMDVVYGAVRTRIDGR